MTTIYARTQDQVLVATILPKLACNNKKTVKLHVDFDATWEGYAKSAIFYTSTDPTVYPEALSVVDHCKSHDAFYSCGECTIPHEVLADAGYLFITIQGINSSTGQLKSTTPISYKILPGTPSLVVSDPSPSIYDRLLTAAKTLEARMNVVETGTTRENSEVEGLRVDADGIVHYSAYDAVTRQIKSVRKGTKIDNLIDMRKITAGWLQATGELSLSHQMSTYYRWEYTSDFIPVNNVNNYCLTIIHDRSVPGWYCLCTYDSDKNFIERLIVTEYNQLEYKRRLNFAYGVAYVRISYRSYMTAKIKFEESDYPTKIESEIFENNLLDVRPLIFDGFIVESGSIYPQTADGYAGDGVPALKEMYSRHIPVIPGEKYTLYQIAEAWAWCAIGIYDLDGKGISRLTTSDTKFEFTIPEGAVTMMVCARTHYLNDLALFKQGEMLCGEQRIRENYLNLHKINETPICGFDDIVKAVNHRGYCTIAPENTLAAFKMSKEKGFKYVECDVSFTSDGYAVLLHDSTIDRTSNGTGNIANKTLAEVRAFDFGSWKSEEYTGEKIPTFDEFVLLCKRLGLHPYIELKTGTAVQIKGLVDVVKRYGMKGNVTWISFDSTYLGYVKAVDTAARLGFVVDSVTASTITTITQSLKTANNDVFIDCAASNATNDAITMCANADIPLEVWTVNTKAAILGLDSYISGVTSDNLIASKVLSDEAMSI